MSDNDSRLRLEQRGVGWRLVVSGAAEFTLVNEYLEHLVDRNYSSKTVRSYGYDLLALCRWLLSIECALGEVNTEVLLRFLRECREAKIPGRAGPNVFDLAGRRIDQYAPATINRRLAAVSGLFAFAAMRDPQLRNPVPSGREGRWQASGERTGMLAHTSRGKKPRSALRLREPATLPKALSQAQAAELLASLGGPGISDSGPSYNRGGVTEREIRVYVGNTQALQPGVQRRVLSRGRLLLETGQGCR